MKKISLPGGKLMEVDCENCIKLANHYTRWNDLNHSLRSNEECQQSELEILFWGEEDESS